MLQNNGEKETLTEFGTLQFILNYGFSILILLFYIETTRVSNQLEYAILQP